MTYFDRQNHEAASENLAKALALNPNYRWLKGMLIHSKLNLTEGKILEISGCPVLDYDYYFALPLIDLMLSKKNGIQKCLNYQAEKIIKRNGYNVFLQ